MAHVIHASAEIDAPLARVWEILVDLPRYPEWNPFTPRIQSTLRPGDPVVMEVHMRPGHPMVRTETVTAFEPESRVCWDMKIASPRLLAAERCQVVRALAEHRTYYETTDRFTGLLVPLMRAMYGQHVKRGFEGVALALKKRAEA